MLDLLVIAWLSVTAVLAVLLVLVVVVQRLTRSARGASQLVHRPELADLAPADRTQPALPPRVTSCAP